MGFPLEYLNPANLSAWEARLGTSGPRDTLTALWRLRTSPNGCFGLKLHYRQLAEVAPHIEAKALLGGACVIRLRRFDLSVRRSHWHVLARPVYGSPGSPLSPRRCTMATP